MGKTKHSHSLVSSTGTYIITNLNTRAGIQPLIKQVRKQNEMNVSRATQPVTDRTRIKAQVF